MTSVKKQWLLVTLLGHWKMKPSDYGDSHMFHNYITLRINKDRIQLFTVKQHYQFLIQKGAKLEIFLPET